MATEIMYESRTRQRPRVHDHLKLMTALGGDLFFCYFMGRKKFNRDLSQTQRNMYM